MKKVNFHLEKERLTRKTFLFQHIKLEDMLMFAVIFPS